jgi:hypothetical protein
MNQTYTRPHKDFVIDYDLMNFVNDTVKAAIKDEIQEKVDKELLRMVNGDSFKRQMTTLIDTRVQSLFQKISIKTTGSGPGRGHVGRTYRKICLSLAEGLYQQARKLEGFFSCHVTAALELYLRLPRKPESGGAITTASLIS